MNHHILFFFIIQMFSYVVYADNMVYMKDKLANSIVNTINCNFVKSLPTQLYTTSDFILNIEEINSNRFIKGTISQNYNMFEQSLIDMTIYQSCDFGTDPFNMVQLRIQGSFVNINRFINLIQEIKTIQNSYSDMATRNKFIQDAWTRADIKMYLKKVSVSETEYNSTPLFIFIILGMVVFGNYYLLWFLAIIIYRVLMY